MLINVRNSFNYMLILLLLLSTTFTNDYDCVRYIYDWLNETSLTHKTSPNNLTIKDSSIFEYWRSYNFIY